MRLRQQCKAEWASEGNRKQGVRALEYVRRSMALRDKKSAYVGMRKSGRLKAPSRVAPQDIYPVPASNCRDRIFLFGWGKGNMFVLAQRWCFIKETRLLKLKFID